jgi:hypothetical protein
MSITADTPAGRTIGPSQCPSGQVRRTEGVGKRLVAVRPFLSEQHSAGAADSWIPVTVAVTTVTTVAAVADELGVASIASVTATEQTVTTGATSAAPADQAGCATVTAVGAA